MRARLAHRLMSGLVVLAFVSIARADDGKVIQNDLRGQVQTWLREHLSDSPEQDVRQGISQDLGDGVASGRDVMFVVDSQASTDHRAYFGMTCGGLLYTFRITDDQVRAAGTRQNEVGAVVLKPYKIDHQASPFPLELGALELDQPDRISRDAKITGTVRCTAKADFAGKSLVVRTHIAEGIDRQRTTNQEIDALPPDGVLHVDVGPLNVDDEIILAPVMVIVDVIVRGETAKDAIVIAAGAGAVLSIAIDGDTYFRASIQFTNKTADILASVVDGNSANEAVEKYVALATAGSAIADAGDKLKTAITPAEEQRLTQQYEQPLLTALKRLSDENERLEATEFGQAFLKQMQARLGS
jgi:hypothetical protein